MVLWVVAHTPPRRMCSILAYLSILEQGRSALSTQYSPLIGSTPIAGSIWIKRKRGFLAVVLETSV